MAKSPRKQQLAISSDNFVTEPHKGDFFMCNGKKYKVVGYKDVEVKNDVSWRKVSEQLPRTVLTSSTTFDISSGDEELDKFASTTDCAFDTESAIGGLVGAVKAVQAFKNLRKKSLPEQKIEIVELAGEEGDLEISDPS